MTAISGTKKMTKEMKKDLTRFEQARILGARALQISMGAPVLVDVPQGIFDPLLIAEIEFKTGDVPIAISQQTDELCDIGRI